MDVRGVRATAWAGLREHRGTSALLVGVAAAGVSAALPVALLTTWGGTAPSRLRLPPLAGVGEPGWLEARLPGQLHAEALRLLFQSLSGVALAALAVSTVAVLLVLAARAGERVGETTLRRAVGASRRALLLAALLEAGALAVIAVVAGTAAACGIVQWATGAWPGPLAPGGWAPAVGVALVMVLALLGGAALAVVFAPRRRLADAAPRPVGLALPSAQLAVALVVLTSGSLLVRQAGSWGTRIDRPADGEVYTGRAALAESGVRATRYAALLRSLQARTLFDSVSLVSAGTVIGLGTVGIATTECGNCAWGGVYTPWHAIAATHRFVSADSFQALGVRVLAGRGITPADGWDAPRVAVVSRALAQQHFQNGEALGRRILLGDVQRTWLTVVGVVEVPPSRALGAALLPAFSVYASVLQHPPMQVELLVRRRPGKAPGPDVRLALAAALGSGAPAVERAGERELLARELTPLAWFGRFIAGEGWAVLIIAGCACALQMSLWVGARAGELGLRRAVGATRWSVMGLVVARAVAVGLIGTAGGLVLGPAVWSALGTVVRGLPGWDGGLVLRFAGLLVGVAIVVAAVPAARVTRAAPARLLAGG
jgi:hypothetical protein